MREFDRATRAYTLYTGLAGGPRDAQLGPDGKLWWLQNDPQAVARMDLSSGLVTTWPVTTSFAVALAFDSNPRVWFVDGILSGVYRFDPDGSQFCDFTMPGGGGPFIAAHDGALWLSEIGNRTLGRITPTTNAYTYWALNFWGGNPMPYGVTFAPNGDVWWADRGLHKIGRLEPDMNRLRLFGPPGLYAPVQVAYQAGKVWFTDLCWLPLSSARYFGQHLHIRPPDDNRSAARSTPGTPSPYPPSPPQAVTPLAPISAALSPDAAAPD